MVTEGTNVDAQTIDSVEEIYDQNAFVDLLGQKSTLKVFVALLDAPEPLNPSSVAENAGIDQSTFYSARDVLLEYGVVEQVDKIGNSPRFALVEDDELVDALRKAADFAGARRREQAASA